jgi:hypothetical protein
MENKQTELIDSRTVTLYTDNVELSVYVNKDLGKDSESLAHPFGHICDCVNRDTKFDWDNLDYFLDYNKEKQKETKKELKEKGAWKPGMNKEIKALIKEAKRLQLL